MLRQSIQAVVVELADSIHSKIDDRVAFKLEVISKKARDTGVDQDFCEEILKYCPTKNLDEEEHAPYIEKQPTIIPNTKPSKPQKPQRPSKDSIGDNPFVASDSHKKLTTVTSERILPRRTAPQASRSVTQNTIISPPKDNEEPLNSKPPVSGLPQRNIQDKNPSDDASTSVKKEINPQNTPQNGSKTQQGNRPLPRPLPDQPTKAKDVQQLENTQKRKSITESPVTLRPTANNRGNNSNARGSASTRAKRHSVATSSSIQSRPLPTPNSTSNCPNSTGSRPLPKPPGNT